MQTVFNKPASHPAGSPTQLPSIEQWIATGLANGQRKTDLFQSMLSVGWKPELAAKTLYLSDEEYRAVGFVLTPIEPMAAGMATTGIDPDVAFRQSIALKAVPRPRLGAQDQSVDAGDRIVRVLHQRQAPDIVLFEGFMDDDECDAMIAMAKPKLTRSTTVDNTTGDSRLDENRTSFGMFFNRAENNLITLIDERIAKLVSWPVNRGEGMQVLRYLPGAEYKPHFDYFDPHQPGSGVLLKRGGQRVGTLLIYLNTPEAGGETVFPDIDFAVTAKRGQAVFFAYAQAHPCSLSLHGGSPVVVGEKWVATKWFREGEFSIPIATALPA